MALTFAVILNAITDPAVSSYSDGFRIKLGRRHPLIYTCVLPLAATFWLLFSPPAGLSTGWMFAWLLVFAAATRVAMIVFAITGAAMFPKLADNDVERAEVLAWPCGFGIISVATVLAVTWPSIFQDADICDYTRVAPVVAL